VTSPRAEAVEEQGEHYDPLFTYKKGDEAGYFAVSDESGGNAADIGPSGVGTSKGSSETSNSLGWTTEGSASEGEPTDRVDFAKDFPVELVETDVVAKTIEATSSFDIALAFWLLLFVVSCLNTILLQVFRPWVRQLPGSRPIFPRGPGVT